MTSCDGTYLDNKCVQISSKTNYTLLLTKNGVVKFAGVDNYGESGNNNPDVIIPTFTTSMGGLNGVKAITQVGSLTTLLLLNDGTVKTTGSNAYKQTYSPTYDQTPVRIPGLSSVVSIAGGGLHACALLSNGTVMCWGQNDRGQLGVGNTDSNLTPTLVPGLTSVVAIACGFSHTCALLSDGTVKCWGINENGQIGNGIGGYDPVLTPTDVRGLSDVAAIACGPYSTFALLSDGSVKYWGQKYAPDDETIPSSLTPVSIAGLPSRVTAIACGVTHACVLLSTGGVMCWGQNDRGQLGDGTTTGKLTPVAITSGAIGIAAGDRRTFAIMPNGDVKAWGYNGDSELGLDTGSEDQLTPVIIANLS
jgi:alpha-tubulin suppressor-like RCC1 family protein